MPNTKEVNAVCYNVIAHNCTKPMGRIFRMTDHKVSGDKPILSIVDEVIQDHHTMDEAKERMFKAAGGKGIIEPLAYDQLENVMLKVEVDD